MRSGGVRKSSSGQVPLVAALLFLFLVPTTVILAENATGNITALLTDSLTANITNSSVNLTGLNATLANVSATASLFTVNLSGNVTIPPADIPLNQTPEDGNGSSSLPVIDATVPENATIQPLNQTIANETENTTAGQESNETGTVGSSAQSQENDTNVTDSQDATISPIPDQTNGTGNKPHDADPELTLDIPDRADRNQPFDVSAILTNSGDMETKNAEIEWILPEDISIIEGSSIITCDIAPGEYCRSDLKVAASLTSMLGGSEIKAIARYRA
jgi:hypothetical protein